MPAISSADQLHEQAKSQLQLRHVDEALALLLKALEVNPRHAASHETLGAIYFSRKEYERSIDHFQKATQSDPRRIDAMINLGAVQNRVGDFQAAAKTLRLAVSRDRKNATAYYNLGIAQKGLNQIQLAVSAYKEALKLNPRMAEAFQNLANLYVEMGNIQQAQFHYHKAIEINPDFERAKAGLKRSYELAEEKKKAINPFGRLVNMEELANRTDSQFRPLSNQERLDDRAVIHQIAKDAEQQAQHLLATIREQVSPLISHINACAQASDPRTLAREYDHLSEVVANYGNAVAALTGRMDDLRAHERDKTL